MRRSRSLTFKICLKTHECGGINFVPSECDKGHGNTKAEISLHQIQKTSKSTKSKWTLTRCLVFIWNPMRANKICYHIKFDIPELKEPSKLSSKIISIKCMSHTSFFKTNFYPIVQNESRILRTQTKVP